MRVLYTNSLMIRNFLCNLSHKPDCHLRCRKWLLLFCLLHQLCHCPITICGPVNMRSTNGICTRSWGRSHCSSLRNRLFSVTRKSSSSLWMLQSQDKEYVRWGQCESLNFFNHLNGVQHSEQLSTCYHVLNLRRGKSALFAVKELMQCVYCLRVLSLVANA